MTEHTLVVFTIISKNYLSAARVLMNSVREHQPRAHRVVILVDEVQGLFRPEHEDFDVIRASELGIRNWRHFAFKYDILELNTAVKPYAFEHMFSRYDAERVIYFDPDIQLYAGLDQLIEVLNTATAVLTPHLTRPITDAYLPSELDILRAGSYNLGFFALAKRGDWLRLLKWWQDKLYYLGSRDTTQGLFVDQRWMDLAPSLFSDVHILRDAGHNVAYWNLSERSTTVGEQGKYTVNGRPLVFFHFSGFSIVDPEAVSKHQNRHRLSDLSPAHQQIFRGYRQAILDSGYHLTRKLPYAYFSFPDGVPISPALRACLLQHDVDAARWPDPFDDSEFRIWATTPGNVPGSSLLSPYALALHAMRPDLRAAFPAPLGASGSAYAGWFVSQKDPPEFFHPVYVEPVLRAFGDEQAAPGAALAQPRTIAPERLRATFRYFREFPTVHRPMLPPDVFKGPPPVYTGPDNLYGAVRQSLANSGVLRAVRRLVGIRAVMTARYYFSYGSGTVLSAAPGVADLKGQFLPGVNVIGYFRHESGVGQIARDLVRSLRVQGFPVSAVDAETPTRAVELAPVGLQHRVNVFSVNADQTYVVQSKLGKRAYKGRYNVGYWFWELPQFPKRWAITFREYDEIWVASDFVRDALRPMTDLPITRVPVPVEVQLPSTPLTRAELGLPDEGFLFLFIFNGASVFTRKNPLGLISAFERAFSQNERTRDVRLVMKVMNLDLEEGEGKDMAEGMRAINGILLSETMDRQVVYNLIDQCDAYASLHRSEGYGLTMAEAMALGKPVIGTAYSGNVDFMDDHNSFLVPYELVTLEHDVPPYEAGSTWAEPNLDEAARLMRLIVDNPQEAAARGARAREMMHSELSAAAVGQIISGRLAGILRSLEGTQR